MSAAETADPASIVNPRTMVALVLISAFSLLAVMALSAYAPQLRSPENAQANVFSKSAIGFAGLVRLLRDCDVPVRFSRERKSRGKTAQASLTILTPTLENSAAQLRETGTPGARLIILPKWAAFPNPLHSNWVMKAAPLEAKLVGQNILGLVSKKSVLARRHGASPARLEAPLPSFQPNLPRATGKIDALQTVAGADLASLLRDGHSNTIVAQIKGTQTYILSDPDLMNTQGLHDLATARTAVALIQQMRVGNGPVVFDVTLNGFGSSPNFLGLAFRPPFLGATICALLAALLIGLHAMSRFGTPQAPLPAFALGKRALAGNTADLIRVMGREPAMTRRYAIVVRNLVLKALGVRRDLGPEQTQALFNGIERNVSVNEHFTALAAEAAQTQTRAHMLRVAQRLYHWKRGITHEHR